MEFQTEITLMDQRLSTMEDKLSYVESKLDSMDIKLNQVIEALKGNPITKDDGLVGRINEINDKVDEHDESLKKIKWFWLGVVAVGGFIGYVINFLFKN